MDVAKAIGIILVVVGHSGSPFHSYIYLFHMALFFFISGYFYSDKYTYHPKKLIFRRLRTLYVPFLLYELLFLLLHNVFLSMNLYSTKVGYLNQVSYAYTIKDFIKCFLNNVTFAGTEQFAGAFWFFVVLFTINVMFCFISFFCFRCFRKNSKTARFLIIILCFIMGMILVAKNIHLPRNMNISLVVLLIYYFGYLFRRIENRIPFNIGLFVLSILCLIIASHYGSIDVLASHYTNPMFFIFVSLVGIYCTMYVSRQLDRMNIRVMRFIGSATISIMALHFLSFKLINLIQIKMYNYPDFMLAKFPTIVTNHGWWVLYSLVGIFIPVALHYVYIRINLVIRKDVVY
ncbi:MAG: acyltransferase family protein [Sporolactobacillus sp.]